MESEQSQDGVSNNTVQNPNGPNTTEIQSGKLKKPRSEAQKQAFAKAREARKKQLEELKETPKPKRQSLRKTAFTLAQQLTELHSKINNLQQLQQQQPGDMPRTYQTDRQLAARGNSAEPSGDEFTGAGNEQLEDIPEEEPFAAQRQQQPQGRRVQAPRRQTGPVQHRVRQQDAMDEQEMDEHEAYEDQQTRAYRQYPHQGQKSIRQVRAPTQPPAIQKRKQVRQEVEEEEDDEFDQYDNEMDLGGGRSALGRADPYQRQQYHARQNRTAGGGKKAYGETQDRVNQFSRWLALG